MMSLLLTVCSQRGRSNPGRLALPQCDDAVPECHKQGRKLCCRVQVRRKENPENLQMNAEMSQSVEEYQNAIIELMFVLGLVALGARAFITWLLQQNRKLEAQLEAQLEQRDRESRDEEPEAARAKGMKVVVKETEVFADDELVEERRSSDRLLLMEEAIGYR